MFTKLYPFLIFSIVLALNVNLIIKAEETENTTNISIENVQNTTIQAITNPTSDTTNETFLDTSTVSKPTTSNINNWPTTVTPYPKDSTTYLKAKDLPNCKRNNNEFSQCLRDILTMGLERLKYGKPEHNVPNLDPFTFNRTVYRYNTGSIKGELFINKARIYGLTKMQYNQIQFKRNNNHIELFMGAFIPQMHITGNYKGKMQYNNFTMRPKGLFNLTLSNVNIDEKTEAIISTDNRYKFLLFNNLYIEPKIGNMIIKATGIFEDNRLNDVVVNVINQYWREFYRVLYATIKDYWSPLILHIMNESVKMAPFDIKE